MKRKQREISDFMRPKREDYIPIERRREDRPLRVRVPNVRSMVWRSSIGHYGGMHVSVPEEHFEKFKGLMPKRTLPRDIRRRDIADNITQRAERLFHKLYPRSKGKLREMYFASGTRGARFFSMDLFPVGVSPVVERHSEMRGPPVRDPDLRRVLRSFR